MTWKGGWAASWESLQILHGYWHKEKGRQQGTTEDLTRLGHGAIKRQRKLCTERYKVMHVGKTNPGFTHSIVLSELISVTGEWHLEILTAQHSIAPKKTQIQIPREDLGAKELVQKEKKIKRWSDYSRQTPSRGGGNALHELKELFSLTE